MLPVNIMRRRAYIRQTRPNDIHSPAPEAGPDSGTLMMCAERVKWPEILRCFVMSDLTQRLDAQFHRSPVRTIINPLDPIVRFTPNGNSGRLS